MWLRLELIGSQRIVYRFYMCTHCTPHIITTITFHIRVGIMRCLGEITMNEFSWTMHREQQTNVSNRDRYTIRWWLQSPEYSIKTGRTRQFGRTKSIAWWIVIIINEPNWLILMRSHMWTFTLDEGKTSQHYHCQPNVDRNSMKCPSGM